MNVQLIDEDADIEDAGVTVSPNNVLFTGSLDSEGEGNGSVTVAYAGDDNANAYLNGISASFRDAVKAQAVDGEAGFDTSLNNGLGYVSRALARGATTASVTRDLNSFAGFAFAGYAPQIGLMTSAAGTDAIAQRAGFKAQTASSIGEVQGTAATVWVTPIYKHSKSDDFKLEGSKYGASTNMYGVALGADFGVYDGFRLGGMLDVGTGKAKGKGNVVKTDNDFDFFGLGIYGTYKYENFEVLADMTYTKVNGDVDQYGAQKLTADLDNDVFTIGANAKYTFNLEALDVVPHLGIRYTKNKVDSYKVKNGGATYLTGKSITQDIVEFPLGVTVSRDFKTGAWTLRPLADITLTPVAGDKDLDAKVSIVGMQHGDSIKTNADVANGFKYSGTIGLDAQYGKNLGLGIGYSYTGSSDIKEHSLVGSFRYPF